VRGGPRLTSDDAQEAIKLGLIGAGRFDHQVLWHGTASRRDGTPEKGCDGGDRGSAVEHTEKGAIEDLVALRSSNGLKKDH